MNSWLREVVRGTPWTVLGSILISFAAAAGALPTGYTQVDYIESTGSQYIDTGYVHTANTRLRRRASKRSPTLTRAPMRGRRFSA